MKPKQDPCVGTNLRSRCTSLRAAHELTFHCAISSGHENGPKLHGTNEPAVNLAELALLAKQAMVRGTAGEFSDNQMGSIPRNAQVALLGLLIVATAVSVRVVLYHSARLEPAYH
jgi:hypothetical protein